jgi:2-amino-4-hydroxy-6-hydroxymethyldihydropteridine diphosphokinase
VLAYIGLGSNLGDRLDYLRRAVAGLTSEGIEPLRLSSVWESEPIACTEPLWFLNMVAECTSELEPLVLLDALQRIERANGRVRRVANEPRTLDLDLLLLDGVELRDPRLCLPHPRMWQRRFVLEPLAEIAADLLNPATGRTVAEERRLVADSGLVRRLGPLAAVDEQPL